MVADSNKIRKTTLFLKCVEVSCNLESFGRFVFIQDVKSKKNVMKDTESMRNINDIRDVRIAKNLRTQDVIIKRKNLVKLPTLEMLLKQIS